MEQIKDIKGYEGLYQVTSEGRVISLNYRRSGKPHDLTPSIVSDGEQGYQMVTLWKDGKSKGFYVHVLVLSTFKPFDGEVEYNVVVNHLDENTMNNNIENLEWSTRGDNIKYSKDKMKGSRGSLAVAYRAVHIETGEVLVYDGSISGSLVEDLKADGFCYKSVHRNANNVRGYERQYKGYKWYKITKQNEPVEQ